MKNWNDIGFTIEMTKDGSPSLRLLKSLNPEFEQGEAMHHSGGAVSETQLIYGQIIQLTFEKILNEKPRFLIVGLGLGYIELFVAAYSWIYGKKIGKLTSYESVPELAASFIQWIQDDPEQAEIIRNTYNQVWESIQTQLPKLTPLAEVKATLKTAFMDEGAICGAIDPETVFTENAHCILYDAFSSKTSPHLWEEAFLSRFLEQAALQNCIFGTYSAKGTLKRALRASGFQLEKRDGFKSKRGSTRAFRGTFLEKNSF